MSRTKVKEYRFETLKLVGSQTVNLLAFASEDINPNFSITASFNFSSKNQVDKIVLTVKNIDKTNYRYNLHSAFICCHLVTDAPRAYFIQYNFLKVPETHVKDNYHIEIDTDGTVDDCVLYMEEMSIIFPSIDIQSDEKKFENCPNKAKFKEIPEDKNGSIIISI